MRMDVFAFWGCGSGPLKALQPATRITSGVLLGLAALVIPLHSALTVFSLGAVTVLWCALSGMPGKVVVRCALAATILFAPFFLLTPWMGAPGIQVSIAAKLAHAGGIALRSTCCLYIAAATISALPIQEIHTGLAGTILPRPIVALVVQLINQAVLLTDETARIVTVLRLRGASGAHGLKVLFSFPVVWVVRMLFRAERTAAAMSVRGYGIETATAHTGAHPPFADIFTIACLSALLVLAALLRTGILP